MVKSMRINELFSEKDILQAQRKNEEAILRLKRNNEICQRYEHGETFCRIAEWFNVSVETVRQVVKKWRPNLLVGRGGKMIKKPSPDPKYCMVCDAPLGKYRSKYCSDACHKTVVSKYRTQYTMRRYHNDPAFRQKHLYRSKQYRQKPHDHEH